MPGLAKVSQQLFTHLLVQRETKLIRAGVPISSREMSLLLACLVGCAHVSLAAKKQLCFLVRFYHTKVWKETLVRGIS